MPLYAIGHRLPNFLKIPLFGDREKWGLTVKPGDPTWKEWESKYLDFYYSTQKKSVGSIINNAGYTAMAWIELNDARVLEIGPGEIRHRSYWKASSRPLEYSLADVKQEMLNRSTETLQKAGIPCSSHLLIREENSLPFENDHFDIVVSFYCLEHIYPLAPHLNEIRRVLKKGGLLVGAIPTEGGLAWGVGRLLTSRRWLKRNTSIDPEKIICWEHPNFAEQIVSNLDQHFQRLTLGFWPLGISLIDLNLILKFLYRKV